MRAEGELYMNPTNFEGGFDTFFYKGTNGRWQDEITPENLALHDAACERALTPECRAVAVNHA
jgi:aryl sulfotransferase